MFIIFTVVLGQTTFITLDLKICPQSYFVILSVYRVYWLFPYISLVANMHRGAIEGHK